MVNSIYHKKPHKNASKKQIYCMNSIYHDTCLHIENAKHYLTTTNTAKFTHVLPLLGYESNRAAKSDCQLTI